MDPKLEIRKLQPSSMRKLTQILEYGDSWKELMAIIPKTLNSSNYSCNITEENSPKYNSEHVRLIENASYKMRKACPDILFDEWGTSGRIRPALGHLLYLLVKAQLFRAADYVAVDLLKIQAPSRPTAGPAALINTNLPDEETYLRDIESYLNETKYPSLISDLNVPQIIVTNVVEKKKRSAHVHFIEISDMIKFPHDNNSSSTNNEENDFPVISDLLKNNENEHVITNNDNSYNFPVLSILNSTTSDVGNIPKLSALLSDSDRNIPNVKTSSISSDSIPHLSSLLLNNSNDLSKTSSGEQRRQCSSPLPNLSLNTKLPHFTYQQLEQATNNFDETPNEISCENLDRVMESGRFLGSGAFGSVFLAVKLLDRPVAVKKLFLDNDVDVVNENDHITKQFKNEVEVLTKYKHENLLSLVGYSCDGPTYCLLYEFLPGGALNDRLQNKAEGLFWKDRLDIALGTAKGISYLHTAYSTPLIHRDVKTANILLDCSNTPKLGDFGIIKLLPNQNTNTGTTVFGTSAYMSPEAFRGDISVKLDTFSFGVVLLELLTSLPPLDNQREGYDIVTYVMEEHCENDISSLLDESCGCWKNEDVNFSEKLYEIAKKCLSEKRSRPTMVQINTELTELIKLIQ